MQLLLCSHMGLGFIVSVDEYISFCAYRYFFLKPITRAAIQHPKTWTTVSHFLHVLPEIKC